MSYCNRQNNLIVTLHKKKEPHRRVRPQENKSLKHVFAAVFDSASGRMDFFMFTQHYNFCLINKTYLIKINEPRSNSPTKPNRT